jgi:hypothetical protein
LSFSPSDGFHPAHYPKPIGLIPWLAKALTVCPILHLICAYIERRKGRALARRPAAGKRYIVRQVRSLLQREQLQPIGGSLGRSIADLRS